MIPLDIQYGDSNNSHEWAFPELCKSDEHSLAAPAVAYSADDRSASRLDPGNEVFAALPRKAQRGPQATPTDGELWAPEVASCLTSQALVNRSVVRWLIDTGCCMIPYLKLKRLINEMDTAIGQPENFP
ncbi:MAG: hypothetical protein ACKPKO_20360, partial [Candidatus Fonsibacter sp.]